MPRRQKPVFATFEAEPYDTFVSVVCGASDAQTKKYIIGQDCECDAEDIEQLDVSVDEAATHSVETYQIVVRFRKRTPDIDTISHESLHVVARILRDAGIELCEETEEAYAYLQGKVTLKIWNAVTA